MAKKKTGKLDVMRERLESRIETKTLRLDSVKYERLQEICRHEGWNASQVVNELISDFLDEIDS